MALPHLKPKGKRGMAQVKKLGRNFKTGGFKNIEEKAKSGGYSTQSAENIAGHVFQEKARKHASRIRVHRVGTLKKIGTPR